MIIGEGVNLFLLGTQSIPSFNPHPSRFTFPTTSTHCDHCWPQNTGLKVMNLLNLRATSTPPHWESMESDKRTDSSLSPLVESRIATTPLEGGTINDKQTERQQLHNLWSAFCNLYYGLGHISNMKPKVCIKGDSIEKALMRILQDEQNYWNVLFFKKKRVLTLAFYKG